MIGKRQAQNIDRRDIGRQPSVMTRLPAHVKPPLREAKQHCLAPRIAGIPALNA